MMTELTKMKKPALAPTVNSGWIQSSQSSRRCGLCSYALKLAMWSCNKISPESWRCHCHWCQAWVQWVRPSRFRWTATMKINYHIFIVYLYIYIYILSLYRYTCHQAAHGSKAFAELLSFKGLGLGRYPLPSKHFFKVQQFQRLRSLPWSRRGWRSRYEVCSLHPKQLSPFRIIFDQSLSCTSQARFLIYFDKVVWNIDWMSDWRLEAMTKSRPHTGCLTRCQQRRDLWK